MVRFYTSLLCCIFLTGHLLSQDQTKIDWSEFREPDGKIFYATIDPLLVISNAKTIGVFSTANYRSLKDRSILNANGSVNYSYNEQNDFSHNVFSTGGSIGYTKYLNSRRGLFIETNDFVYFANDFTDGNKGYRLNLSLGLGVGRLEEISTVNQAYRILNNVDGLSETIGNDSEQIFDLATHLRELDYHFVRDRRIRNIDRLSSFLDYFKSRNIDLNNTYTTAQLVDGYSNSRYLRFYYNNNYSVAPGHLSLPGIALLLGYDPIGEDRFGQKASISLVQWNTGDFNDENYNFSAIRLDLMKSFGLSNTLRLNTYAAGSYVIDSEPDVSYAYKIGTSAYYTLDSRTGLSTSVIYRGAESDLRDLHYVEVELGARYFLSYSSVLSASVQYIGSEEVRVDSNYFRLDFTHYFY